MPTPSSTASFTTLIGSISPATAFGAGAPDQLQRIDHWPATCQKHGSRAPASQATSSRIAGRHHLGISGRLRRNLHVSDAEMAALNIKRAEFHGEWNYTISPNIYPPNCAFIS
jgi:hypothetical protein